MPNLINLPTRSCKTGNSCIDVCLTNIANVSVSGVIDYGMSDHCPVFVSKKRTHDVKNRIRVRGRTYRHYDRGNFMSNLRQLDWSVMPLLNNPNDIWNMINSALTYEVDKSCPIHEFYVKNNLPEWYTHELMEESRDRDILLRLAKQHQDNYHWNRFIEARNAFKTSKKRLYFEST